MGKYDGMDDCGMMVVWGVSMLLWKEVDVQVFVEGALYKSFFNFFSEILS